MPYNTQTERGDAQALIPEEISEAMLTSIEEQSAALAMFRHVPISSNQVRMPVLAALPVAYFVTGDTGLKQTTKAAWENRYFNVEEIACILPVPENVIEDMDFDFWNSVRPEVETAIGRALDAAIFFGVNKPTSWPASISQAASAVGNVYARGTNAPALGGVAEDISQLFTLLENQGQDITGVIARQSMRGAIRSARDSTGQRTEEVTATNWWGVEPIMYPMRGLWPTGGGGAEAITGDFSKGLIGIRRDVTVKMFDQGIVQDQSGNIIFNLMQNDMVAARVVARYAFEVANPINYDAEEVDARYPFAVMTAPGS